MKIEKRSGERTPPCGTPATRSAHSEQVSDVRIACLRPCRYDLNQSTEGCETLTALRHANSTSKSTELKALLKSRRARIVSCVLFMARRISSVTFTNAVEVLWPVLKPDCKGLRSWCSFKKFTNWAWMMRSNTLDK